MEFDLHLVSHLMKVVGFLAGLALLLRLRLKPAPVCLFVVAGSLFFVGVLHLIVPLLGVDYHIFWKVGRELRAGGNPYAPDLFVVYPPNALPLFVVFALLPFPLSYAIWTWLNALACLALVTLARETLMGHEGTDAAGDRGRAHSWDLPASAVVVLTICFILSDASFVTFFLGQLSILEALLLIAALYAQSRGKPVWAGVLLGLATIKAGTMLPFLLLFCRKGDRWAWVSLVGTVLVLCVILGRPLQYAQQAAALPERIKEVEAPGMPNDYTVQGPWNESLLGFDHAFSCLGLRDNQVIRIAQYGMVLALGAWVARQVMTRKTLPRGAACSLVALYSTVFLYHRSYDAVILVLPLVYCVGRARAARGTARALFVACAVAILMVLYLNIELLRVIRMSSLEAGDWGRVVQAVVLPYGTWLIVLTMVLLVIGVRVGEVSGRAIDPVSGAPELPRHLPV